MFVALHGAYLSCGVAIFKSLKNMWKLEDYSLVSFLVSLGLNFISLFFTVVYPKVTDWFGLLGGFLTTIIAFLVPGTDMLTKAFAIM